MAKQMQQQQWLQLMDKKELLFLGVQGPESSKLAHRLTLPTADGLVPKDDRKDMVLDAGNNFEEHNSEHSVGGNEQDLGEIALTCCPPPGGYGLDPLCGLSFQVKFGVPFEVNCFEDEDGMDDHHFIHGPKKTAQVEF
ncbi:hypothetical protein ACA910_022706 [Epithemia clementina (nom. ined.)]